MTREQEIALYRLLRVPGLGAGGAGRVLAAWRDQPGLLAAFWGRRAEEYRAGWGLTRRAALFLQGDAGSEDSIMAAAADSAAARAAEIELLTVLDGEYERLAAIRDLPPALFTRGNQDLLWDAGTAIPHSRAAPEEALAWSAELATALAAAGGGLVTGHNRDGYRRVAAAAKRAGAPLVIALDRPLHGEPSTGPGAEPVVTARLWDAQFRRERELVLSAGGPGEPWVPGHARRRDALILGLATVVVAGAVRPGGIMADLCARALAARRPVFRSPFCWAELGAKALPAAIDAASAAVIQAAQEESEDDGSGRNRLRRPRPGWLERHWSAEAAAFVAALETVVGRDGWVERRGAGPAAATGTAPQAGLPEELMAVVLLPASAGGQPAEMVVVGRRGPHGRGGEEAALLLLSPGEAIHDLDTFQAYLARCRTRVQDLIRIPPRTE